MPNQGMQTYFESEKPMKVQCRGMTLSKWCSRKIYLFMDRMDGGMWEGSDQSGNEKNKA